jgi:hypothetical protein
MYISQESTFDAAGIGNALTGQLGLQNITVIVTTLSTVSGSPGIALDLQYGDNQNVVGGGGGNSDKSWASGAVTTGITVPTTAGTSASAVVPNSGCARAVRPNVTWGTPSGSFKVQIAARDRL